MPSVVVSDNEGSLFLPANTGGGMQNRSRNLGGTVKSNFRTINVPSIRENSEKRRKVEILTGRQSVERAKLRPQMATE